MKPVKGWVWQGLFLKEMPANTAESSLALEQKTLETKISKYILDQK